MQFCNFVQFCVRNVSRKYFLHSNVSCSIYSLHTVCNAGIGAFSVLECTPTEKAQEAMDVNFFGTYRLIKAALPSMKARQSGHIINCASEGGIIGMPFFEIYTASKFAVEGLTESLAPMLRQFNIRFAVSLFKVI